MNINVTQAQIAVLPAVAGDTVVVTLDERYLSDEVIVRFREHLQRFLPEGVKAMVLTKGTKVEVIKKVAA